MYYESISSRKSRTFDFKLLSFSTLIQSCATDQLFHALTFRPWFELPLCCTEQNWPVLSITLTRVFQQFLEITLPD